MSIRTTILVFVFAMAPLIAQVSSGDLIGTVTDATGAAVTGATVDALNTATGVKTVKQTDAAGQFRFPNLLAGSYDLTVNAAGFTPSQLKGIAISVNRTFTANVTLQIGQVSTSVDVVASSAVIDTTTANITATFNTREARDLPVTGIGLGVLNLSLLSAGVASNGGIGVGEGPSVGGQRPYNNNFTIEGVDNNNKSITGSLVRFIPNDAVEEFTIQQNQMSAEFGHSSGGQFNTIIKSGTNSVHGTLYEYMQNRNLNAIDQVVQNGAIAAGDRPSNPRSDNNRLGATIGGPVLKNKLFYFGAFEYNPFGASATVANLLAPTAGGLSALSSMSNLSSTNLSIFKQYVPAAPSALSDTSQYPVVNGTPIPVGLLPVAGPNYQNGYYAVASSDYVISENDQLRGRYVYNKISSIDFVANLPVFFQPTSNNYYLATLAEYHNFTPTLLNEFRLGYNRFNSNLPSGNYSFPGLDAFPNITINELGLDIGPDDNAPQSTIQNTYQLMDTLSWNKGAHNLKFGVDLKRFITPQSFTQRSRGDYQYSSLELFLRDITPDSLAQRGLGNSKYYGDQIATYYFVNDSWRIRPNFTVNLGLRYEYMTVPQTERLQSLNHIADTPGAFIFNEPKAQKWNFSPRVGIAWSPGKSGKTSIRAGFGISHDVLYDNIGILSVPPQFGSLVDVTNSAPDPFQGGTDFLKNGGILANAPTGTLTRAEAIANTSSYIPDLIKLPYAVQWNFGIQHVFAKDYTFEARYLGTRGVHLDVQMRPTVSGPVTADHSLPTYLQMPSQSTLDALPLTLTQLSNEPNILPRFLNAGFNNIALAVNEPIGNSIYHGLALQLNRRFSQGLQMVAAYTWSHLIDDSTADFFTTVLTPRRPQDFQNLGAERSSSALDRRHRLTISAIYQLPFFKQSNWALKNIVGNWSVAPIYTYESPEWATVQSATDSNMNGDSWTDRTIINPAGVDATGSGVTALTNSGGDVVAYLADNPNARYIRAGVGAYANGGRNTLPGRPINNWDINLLKDFTIREGMRLQFSAQFLNAFNHAQFVPGFVDRVDNPQVLNTGASVRQFLNPGSPTFNQPELVFGSNPRNIQLAVKFIF